MPQFHSCASCGRNDIKLFRSYGSFLRNDEIFCKKHIPPSDAEWYVPMCEDTDGSVWGYTSVPNDAIDRFENMPDE